MLTYPNIDSLAFSIGPLKVHWYGLMYLFGFIGAWIYGVQRSRREDLDWTRKQVEDVIFFGALGVILGGRLGYTLFYGWDIFINDPLSIFYIWKGGMSFHGGVIGVLLGGLWFSWRQKVSFLSTADMIAASSVFGLFLGRIANFINGELWGRPTDLPWAMVFPQAGDALARHPSQLYQFAGEGLLLFLILWRYSAGPRQPGQVSGMFLVGYGVLRFLAEFARQPDVFLGTIAMGLTMGQLLCLPMVAFGLWLLRRGVPGR